MKALHQYCLLASARLEHIVLFSTMNQQKNAKRGLRKGYYKIRERKLFIKTRSKIVYVPENKFLQEREKHFTRHIFCILKEM